MPRQRLGDSALCEAIFATGHNERAESTATATGGEGGELLPVAGVWPEEGGRGMRGNCFSLTDVGGK
mgnify:CR=1 FL=1